jgi:photosystem II stability/assembly factor-like uncharacterized protein
MPLSARLFALGLALPLIAHAQWSPVTFTNADLRAKGTLTGDGCQWVRALAIAPTDGNFMLWCTDVGGLFRSLDGGKNWEPTNVGFHSRGSSGVAIDPHNPRRVLVVAANSVPTDKNGLYLSTDQAASWKQVLPVKMSATRDQRRQVAFDPSTYDAAAGFTRVVYWSRLNADPAHNPAWGETITDPGFYKSVDGGETWAKIPGGEIVADAQIAVHPKNGYVYAGTPSGLRVSRDGGLTWTLVHQGRITGLAVTPAAPDSVWITLADAVYRSDDSAKTFVRQTDFDPLAKKDAVLQGITVAPSDAGRIALWRRSPDWQWPRFVTHDGGKTWITGRVLGDRVIVPSNAREGLFAFHPGNPDILLAPGGDYPVLSHDGGRTYALAGNGVNNIFIGGGFNFSAVDPDVLFVGSQDYATLLTTDGGANWLYTEPGKKGWGGYNYAAYASTPQAMIVGESESWGGPKLRAVSHDGGATWDISKEAIKPLFTYGDPRDAKVLFAGDRRSTDNGHTWSPMKGVSSVRTHDAVSGHLFGVREAKDQPAAIVVSADHGATWADVFTIRGGVDDLAVDGKNGRIYVAAGARLRVWDKATSAVTDIKGFAPDPDGAPRIQSVAVDPVDPSVLYIAGCRNVFASNASAQRSLDGGATWTNLAVDTPLDGKILDGGRESLWVRVNPKTREAWFATSCYGMWKYAPPAQAQE